MLRAGPSVNRFVQTVSNNYLLIVLLKGSRGAVTQRVTIKATDVASIPLVIMHYLIFIFSHSGSNIETTNTAFTVARLCARVRLDNLKHQMITK